MCKTLIVQEQEELRATQGNQGRLPGQEGKKLATEERDSCWVEKTQGTGIQNKCKQVVFMALQGQHCLGQKLVQGCRETRLGELGRCRITEGLESIASWRTVTMQKVLGRVTSQDPGRATRICQAHQHPCRRRPQGDRKSPVS